MPKLILILIVSGLSASLQAQNEQTLRWELDAGETLLASVSQSTSLQTDINKRTQTTGSELTIEMTWNVASVTDNQYLIDQKISRIQLAITAPVAGGVQKTTVDTASKTKAKGLSLELLEQIKPLVGIQFKVTMNDRGELIDIELPADSLQELQQSSASLQLNSALSEEGWKQLLGQATITFPEQAISEGHSWEANSSLPFKTSNLNQKRNFTVTKLTDQSAVISVTQNIENENQDLEPKISAAKTTGQIRFAAKEDKIVDCKVNSRVTITRSYRDKLVKSTVETNTSIQINRQSDE